MDKLKRLWRSDNGDVIGVKTVVHSFRLSDVSDPDIYAAQPLREWEVSEAGKWVMANALEAPTWHRNHDINTYGYQYQVRAYLTPENITYFQLKFK